MVLSSTLRTLHRIADSPASWAASRWRVGIAAALDCTRFRQTRGRVVDTCSVRRAFHLAMTRFWWSWPIDARHSSCVLQIRAAGRGLRLRIAPLREALRVATASAPRITVPRPTNLCPLWPAGSPRRRGGISTRRTAHSSGLAAGCGGARHHDTPEAALPACARRPSPGCVLAADDQIHEQLLRAPNRPCPRLTGVMHLCHRTA